MAIVELITIMVGATLTLAKLLKTPRIRNLFYISKFLCIRRTTSASSLTWLALLPVVNQSFTKIVTVFSCKVLRSTILINIRMISSLNLLKAVAVVERLYYSIQFGLALFCVTSCVLQHFQN